METEIKRKSVVVYDGRITFLKKTTRKRLGIKEGSFLELENYKGKILISRPGEITCQ